MINNGARHRAGAFSTDPIMSRRNLAMLLGYRYILAAVALGARRLDKSTTYSIAYAFDTAPINVERACRYALSRAAELS